jgi:hypothetical protein
VFENTSALIIHFAQTTQREAKEEQDDVPCGFAGALVESDQTEQVLYSAINLKIPEAVPE